MQIVDLFKRWYNRRRDKAVRERYAALASEFEIVEHDGNIYLTASGLAFGVAAPEDTAHDLVKRLNIAREAAQSFGKTSYHN